MRLLYPTMSNACSPQHATRDGDPPPMASSELMILLTPFQASYDRDIKAYSLVHVRGAIRPDSPTWSVINTLSTSSLVP